MWQTGRDVPTAEGGCATSAEDWECRVWQTGRATAALRRVAGGAPLVLPLEDVPTAEGGCATSAED